MKVKYYLSAVLLITMISCAEKNESNSEETKSEINVKVSEITKHSGISINQYSGLIEADNILPQSFATSGNIEHVFVNEGEHVKKGQILAKLNTTYAASTYEMAMLKLNQAQDAYNRLLPMKENGTFPEIKFIEVETGLNQAKSAVQIAEKNLTECSLYAKKDGIIGRKLIQPGMNILPTSTAFELYKIDFVKVKVEIPENEIYALHKGDSASVYIKAVNYSYVGIIDEISVAADLLSHTYTVKATIPNQKELIKPGMVCNVKINSTHKKEGFLVPNSALQNSINEQFIYILNVNQAIKQPVKTIELIGNSVLISGNINLNDKIIISGQQKISDGSIINVIR